MKGRFYSRLFFIAIVMFILSTSLNVLFFKKFRRVLDTELLKVRHSEEISYSQEMANYMNGNIMNGVLPSGVILSLNQSQQQGKVVYWFVTSRNGKLVQAASGTGKELANAYTDKMIIKKRSIKIGKSDYETFEVSLPINITYSLQISYPLRKLSKGVLTRIYFPVMLMCCPSMFILVVFLFLLIKEHRTKVNLQEEQRHSKRMAYLGEMSGELAHEMKNPLNTVKMNIQLIQENPQLSKNDGLMKKIGRIDRELDHLTKFLSNFLLYAKAPVISPARFDLNDTVSQVVKFFAPECISTGVTLLFTPLKDPLFIRADKKQINQMLLNLLLNAKEVSEVGSSIKVTLEKIGRQAILSIEDQGPGITPENVEKIFTPFYTTKKRGTGIGMSVVKRIAEDHGAIISIVSNEGKGTKFTITFKA